MVQVHDAARRASTAQRIARNLDVLVRGVGARVEAGGTQVEFAEAPECRVGSQRVLCALGVLMRQVGLAAKAPVLDVKSESYVATWNVAGGHRSAQAPSAFRAKDQRAAVMGELSRWR